MCQGGDVSGCAPTAAEPGGNPTVVQQKVETIVDRFKQLQAKPTDGKNGSSSSSGRPKPTARDAGRQTKRTQSTSAVSCNEWLQRHSGDDFVPAAGPKHRTRESKFEGARTGFVFKLGPRGLGYYRQVVKEEFELADPHQSGLTHAQTSRPKQRAAGWRNRKS